MEDSEKPAVAKSQTKDTSGWSHQCSNTEPRQLDNNQPSKSSTQVILNASVTHLVATQYVWSELH